MKLPEVRTENLVEQITGSELLIYDLKANKAYALNETSKTVYEACNNQVEFDEFRSRSNFSDEIIYLALDELKRHDLLVEDYISPFANTTRREVIKKVGLASLIALPVITGLIAPTAAHAASVCPDPFSPSGIPNGCTTGGNINDVQSCAAQSDADRTNLCITFRVFGSRCASGRTEYGGDCRDIGPNSSSYSCICAA